MRLPVAQRVHGLVALVAGAAALAVGCNQAVIAEPIGVTLADGASVRGEVDEQTDAERLWLRRDEAGVVLCSGYPWDDVVAIHRGANRLVGAERMRAAAELKTPTKSVLDITPVAAPTTSAAPPAANPSVSGKLPRVASLCIEVQLAHWSHTATTDGIEVFIYPLSADGQLVPVRGQLDLTLFAELVNARGGEFTVLRPEFRQLESASELVRPSDFADGPAVYQLPFRRCHPDADFEIAPAAVVHARLGISGQGVFEASADCVPLRGFSPLRDQLQLYTGHRFFPGENVDLRPRLPRSMLNHDE